MRFFLFIIRLKAKAFLNDNSFSGGLRILFFFLMLLVTILYAVGTGFLLNYLASRYPPDMAQLVSRLNLAAGALIVLKGYFPLNTRFKSIFLPAHPLADMQKAFLQACFDLFTPFYLLLLLFYIVLACTANGFTWSLLGSSALNILAFYLPERILKMQQGYGFAPALLLLAANIFALWKGGVYALYVQPAVIIIAGALYTILYRKTIQEDIAALRRRQGKGPQSPEGITWSAIVRRKPLRAGMIAAWIFKLIFCALILFTLQKNRQRLDDLSILLALFCSPVVICNYVLNNLFGYVPQLFSRLAHMVSPGTLFRRFLHVHLRFALPDFLLSLVVLLALEASWKYPLFLLCAHVNAAIISFQVSLLAPKKITKAFDITSFKSNTSIFGNILLGLSIYMLFRFAGDLSLFLLLEAAFLLIMLLVWRFACSGEYERRVRLMMEKII